ncbi:hypothetical protein LEMLEM_LOCUS6250 [Lemmus lemmus]
MALGWGAGTPSLCLPLVALSPNRQVPASCGAGQEGEDEAGCCCGCGCRHCGEREREAVGRCGDPSARAASSSPRPRLASGQDSDGGGKTNGGGGDASALRIQAASFSLIRFLELLSNPRPKSGLPTTQGTGQEDRFGIQTR